MTLGRHQFRTHRDLKSTCEEENPVEINRKTAFFPQTTSISPSRVNKEEDEILEAIRLSITSSKEESLDEFNLIGTSSQESSTPTEKDISDEREMSKTQTFATTNISLHDFGNNSDLTRMLQMTNQCLNLLKSSHIDNSAKVIDNLQ